MERELLRQIPELEELHAALEAAGVADLVWEVVGGNPAEYDLLRGRRVKALLEGRTDFLKVVEDFLRDKLRKATNTFNLVKAANPSLTEPVYSRFKAAEACPADLCEQYALPMPDKVLRLIDKEGDEEGVLKPATPAMALVLRHSVRGKPPSLDVVRKALAARGSITAAAVTGLVSAPRLQ